MFEKILKYLYFDIECKDELPYLDNAELLLFARQELSEEKYRRFEELLIAYSGEVSQYWFIKGGNTVKLILSEILNWK